MALVDFLISSFFAFAWARFGVLAEPSPTSPNDPLRLLSIQTSRKPEPVCCLQAPSTRDSLQDEVLLSFEEWKRRQSLDKAGIKVDVNHSTLVFSGKEAWNDHDDNSNQSMILANVASMEEGSENVDDSSKPEATELLPPHFRVPLTDRFNYASSECSAQVHLAHSSAKSPFSILSSKRDRYMLSPCGSKEQHFVIVELCEDIMIDTVQLANFEFFSGVFKDIKVSVAKTYSTDSEGWNSAGIYRAKNIRGVQSFHPPRGLRDFYRYIRIDFLSYYGNEFYCPVSLLRVYGLTHLEQFKWDVWEAESRAKHSKDIPSPPLQATISPHLSISQGLIDRLNEQHSDVSSSPPLLLASLSGGPSEKVLASPDRTVVFSEVSTSTRYPSPVPTFLESGSQESTSDVRTDSSAKATPSSALSEVLMFTTPTNPLSSPTIDSSSIPLMSSEDIELNSHVTSMPSSAQATAAATISSVFSLAVPPSQFAPVTTGGESIYRTIMNRLTALEANHTLYLRYVEQQNNGIQGVLRRLAEDVGRLEGITRGHLSGYQRQLREWEQQKQQLYFEHKELMLRLEHLSDEIILEKRVGIIQLCLLLIVLVFMGLTRGSRVEHVRFNNSVKEWSLRHLRSGTDWTSRLRSNRSILSPKKLMRVSPVFTGAELDSSENETLRMLKRPSTCMNTHRLQRDNFRDINLSLKPRPRSRTPSLRGRHHNQHRRPASPNRYLSSHLHSHVGTTAMMKAASGPGNGHRHAKKKGHIAHLHEVRNTPCRDDGMPSCPTGMSVSHDMPLAFPVPCLRNSATSSAHVGNDGLNTYDIEGEQWEDTDLDGSEVGDGVFG